VSWGLDMRWIRFRIIGTLQSFDDEMRLDIDAGRKRRKDDAVSE
jgi:hypothetical protein